MFKTNKIAYFNCYTLAEVGDIVGRSEKTVREFIKEGLKTIDTKKPFLVRGLDLIEFLKRKNLKNQCHTNIDEMFCLKCREARIPKAKQIEIRGNEQRSFFCACAQCPVCGTIMNKPYKIDQLSELKRIFHLVEKLSIHDSCDSPQNYRNNDNTNKTAFSNYQEAQLCINFTQVNQ